MAQLQSKNHASNRPGGVGNRNISCAFQPIVNVAQRRVFSYEALLRGGQNEPPEILFSEIGDDELLDFDRQSRHVALALAGELGVSCNINLNFLPRSLQGTNESVESVMDSVQSSGLRIDQIVIEITEREIINEHESFLGHVNDFRGLGAKIAIDDFGAGYSGLNLLANFQPEMVKLDMQLVRGIESHGPRQSIVRAVSQVCFELGIDLIAEGVETLDEYLWFKDQDIHLFQGYLFARPGFECLPEVYYPGEEASGGR